MGLLKSAGLVLMFATKEIYLKQFTFLKRKQLTVMALKPHENENKFGKIFCIKR